jgi:hypothetical protein
MENIGNESAKNWVANAKMYVGKPYDETDQKRLSREFEKWWRHPEGPNLSDQKHCVGKLIAPSDKQTFFSFYGPILNDKDPDKMKDKSQGFYTFVRIEYSDNSGRWRYDYCEFLPDPTHDLLTARPCSVNNNPRYRISMQSD